MFGVTYMYITSVAKNELMDTHTDNIKGAGPDWHLAVLHSVPNNHDRILMQLHRVNIFERYTDHWWHFYLERAQRTKHTLSPLTPLSHLQLWQGRIETIVNWQTMKQMSQYWNIHACETDESRIKTYRTLKSTKNVNLPSIPSKGAVKCCS